MVLEGFRCGLWAKGVTIRISLTLMEGKCMEIDLAGGFKWYICSILFSI